MMEGLYKEKGTNYYATVKDELVWWGYLPGEGVELGSNLLVITYSLLDTSDNFPQNQINFIPHQLYQRNAYENQTIQYS